MAGIGFELKKIFKEENLVSIVMGAGYSTIVTIGPTVIIIGVIVLLYVVLGFFSISYSQRELLSSTILYAFVFSLIFTSPFNAVASRYIADKIYYEQYDDILPSFYCGLLACVALGAVTGIPFLLHVWLVGKIPFLFVWFSYGLFTSLIVVFYSANYLVATKEYKIIALYYTLGMALTFVSALAFYHIGKLPTISCVLYGLTIGFWLIAFLTSAYIRKYFNTSSKNYKEYFHYCRKHHRIFLTNLFYTLGLYVHNFIFWAGENHIIVAKTYVSSPAYDMASFLAMFSNISMIIIFTVMAETKFHDIYQQYNESVIGASYAKITLNRRRMFRLLIQQISYLIMTQAVISGIMFLIANAFLPQFGFSGLTITIYPMLSTAYFSIFTTYCIIIFLFYFDDSFGSMMTTIIFFVTVFLSTLLVKRLMPELYGVGPLAGGLISWTFGYFRIRYLERHFDRHIFCGVTIVTEKDGDVPNNIVYKSGKKQA